MTSRARPLPASPRQLVGLVLPLAFFASVAALSAFRSDPQSAAETAFLGLLSTVLLSAVMAIDREPPAASAGMAVLVAFALWALPAGDVRLATSSLLLTAAAALILCRRLALDGAESLADVAVPLAIGAQALFRPELWLVPGWRPDFLLPAVLIPAVAGLALSTLTRAHGPGLLLGAGLAVAIARGPTPELTLVLTIFAAVTTAARSHPMALLWALAAGTVVLANRSNLDELWLVAVLALAAALLVDERGPSWRSGVALTAAAGMIALAPAGGWLAIPAGFARLVVVLPALLAPRRDRRLTVLGALFLAAAGLAVLPPQAALAAPILALFVCLLRHTTSWQLQSAWTTFLIVLSALCSGLPWLRPDPVATALGLVGLEGDWRSAGLGVAAFWGLALSLGGLDRIPGTSGRSVWARRSAIALMAGALLVQTVPAARPLLDEPFILSSAAPEHELAAAGRITQIRLDSYASNSPAVPPGTPLASILVVAEDGLSESRLLVSGVDTGEWAARRPGLAVVAPEPWISWLAPGGTYFAQRYRTVWRLESPIEAAEILFERSGDLPADLELAVVQIGTRR